MIKSMTGFGKDGCRFADKIITLELRSLNSRQFDLNLKIPSLYREMESVIRNEISRRLYRGKIDLLIQFEYTGNEHIPVINTTVVKQYIQQLTETCTDLKINVNDQIEIMKIALSMPEIMISKKPETSDEEWTAVYNSLLMAIEQLDNYRMQEGKAMAEDIGIRVKAIDKHLEEISKFEKKRLDKIRERLRQNLTDFFNNPNADRNRFEQEIIYYIEKLDITEEKIRLKNHLNYLKETLMRDEYAGKKIGFISQEIGREINTIGSKANDFNIQKIVVQMKDELEKIKEQALNII